MSRSRLEQIESLGRAVDGGRVSLDDAARALADGSSGELTRAHAADLIENWRDVRAGADIVLDAVFAALGDQPTDQEGP